MTTGRLTKKSDSSTDSDPSWLVIPTDQTRDLDEVPASEIIRTIPAKQVHAMAQSGNMKAISPLLTSTSNSNSDGSVDDGTSGNEDATSKKRKSDDSNSSAPKRLKNGGKAGGLNSSKNGRYGTRSTRGSGEADAMPELPARKAGGSKPKKAKKDDKNVKVVRMKTGTLYLYRGEAPWRAEFKRFK